MHWEAFSFFQSCGLSDLVSSTRSSVLDIGAYDINGSLRYLFQHNNYTGLDLSIGPNVDVVSSGEQYQTHLRYDITLSCECFEHNPNYTDTFLNMIYLTKPNGIVAFTCATTGRTEHGTKRTSPHSSIASQHISSEYYKNLTEENFSKLELDNIFSSYHFFTNPFSKDLYFIGRKKSLLLGADLPLGPIAENISKILAISESFSEIERNIATKNIGAARELILQIYTSYPISNLLLTKLMRCSVLINDCDMCIKFGEEASLYDFNQVANLTLQSSCYVKKKELNKAYELLEKVKGFPQILSPKTSCMLADIEFKLFSTKNAIDTILKSLSIFPNECESLWRLATWSKEVENIPQAESALNTMKELYPTDKRVLAKKKKITSLVGATQIRRKVRVLIDDRERHLRAYGFGRVALSLITAYQRNPKVKLFVAVSDPAKTKAELPEGSNLVSINYIKYNEVKDEDFDYALSVCPPERYSPLIKNSFIYTMVDVSDIPSSWLKNIKDVKGILVPSQKNKTIFSQHFPFVELVPLDAPASPFQSKREWRAEGSPKLSFIFVGTHSFRKGFEILVEAFLREFDSTEAKLTIISTESPPDRVCNAIITEMNEVGKVGDIEIITKPMTDAWLARFYARHDCFVLFSRGEGWGYPAMEAAAIGLPVICPEGIASWDFLNPDYNFMVPSKNVEIDSISSPFAAGWKNAYGNDGLSFRDVSVEDAQKSMRAVYDKKDNLIVMGDASSKHVLKEFSMERLVSDIATVNENIIKLLELK